MRKRGLSLIALFATAQLLSGQAFDSPIIQWSKTFAGNGEDRVAALERMPGGGCILGCSSSSGVSGDKTAPGYGSVDFWVLRFDDSGSKVWEASFGGTGGDELRGAKPTPNGGVILAGVSASEISGNKTAPLIGEADLWLVLLDRDGNKVWDKSLGGVFRDRASAVECMTDGGFIVGGSVLSSTNYGDFFIAKLDASGDKLWERCFGTVRPEHLTDLRQTADGGFVLAGDAEGDLWVVRIDREGNKLWDRTFGGSEYDGECRIRVLSDGGFILGAATSSDVSGNKTTPLQGNYDYWVLRLDAQGNKLWERDFGGTRVDYFSDVHVLLDGGFVMAGFSFSESGGNKTAPWRRTDGYDLWLVRLDEAGNRIWDETYDGIHRMGPARIQQDGDGGLILGASFATYTNIPIQDVILFKLTADALTTPRLRPLKMSVDGAFSLQLSGIFNRTYVTEWSGDLRTWAPMGTNRLMSGTAEIVDGAPGNSNRFYRARMVE